MSKIINEILCAVKRSQQLIIIGAIIFILGLILGVFVNLPTDIVDIFSLHSITYYINVLSAEYNVFSLLFSRIFNYFLLLVVVGLFCLNKYTMYINFIILLYRALLLGVALKTFVCNIMIIGAILYVFLILIQALIISLSILIYLAIMNGNNKKTDSCTLNLALKGFVVCFIVAIIGAILEFLLIAMLFRPLNFCF